MEALEDYAPRPQPPVPTTSKGLIDLVFDSIDDPFKSPNVSRLVNVEHLDGNMLLLLHLAIMLTPLTESPQMSKIPVATTKAPSAPLSILDDIVSKAATLKHSIDQSLKASQPLHSSESTFLHKNYKNTQRSIIR